MSTLSELRNCALAATALAACWTGDPPTPQPPATPRPPAGPSITELTPQGLEGIWLGMPLDDFKRARPQATPVNVGDVSVRREYFEDFLAEKTRPPDVNAASYYFGPTLPYPLYEIRVVFEDLAHADHAYDQRYVTRGMVTGPRTERPDDIEDLSALVTIKTTKFDVGVWTYENRLVVAGALPFTERSDGSFGEPLR